MTEEQDPTVEGLRRRQLETERAERSELAHADDEAAADTHRRRADKARYLRDKLEQQQQADVDVDEE